MKTSVRLISLLLLVSLAVGIFAGCQGSGSGQTTGSAEAEFVDYVSEIKLDLQSTATAKQEVTVKSFIDGDTTHFHVPTSISPDGVLKARYLAVNTPESTGKIEEWGKKASDFTKEKLSSATSIIIESDDEKWNADSTGGRYLVWVWYKTAQSGDYRCLNLELIQNGLSVTGGNASLRYGSTTIAAYEQARQFKLHVHSQEKDPGFYYGEAYEIDLKGLRTNIELYDNTAVAFTGVVTRNNNNSVYVEQYDAETDTYFGMSVYYGYATGTILNILKVGNLVRVVGTVTYYETGGTWQVSGLSYRELKPNDPGNTQLVSTGHSAANRLTEPKTFTSGQVTVEAMTSLDSDEVVTKTMPYAQAAMSTSIRMNNLYVKDIYTTNNGGDSDGAMTLTCEADGITISVRTVVLRKENGELYTASDFLNKTIDVTGIIDYFSGDYQIKVFTPGDIIVHE